MRRLGVTPWRLFLAVYASLIAVAVLSSLGYHWATVAWTILSWVLGGAIAVALLGLAAVAGYLKWKARKKRWAWLSEISVPGSGQDDDREYTHKYGTVRRIHGDDNASRLTREQVEAEYDRYDRAETAAAEERCQTCDPEPVPAVCVVHGWDDRPGRERHIGEWVLCGPHAEAKVTALRQSGASAVSEPFYAGDAR